ncbi:hypothetical protein CLV58_1428 [Spirosoma oryzae]|uniref:Uncharacterized protein n=1 Tax=Spirosoma oryzae TaxID=1469603 RepID=A0A2T0RQ23_9BACT|nr:hypothetical protein CLV58_1428 [Spirosoma oryzae]
MHQFFTPYQEYPVAFVAELITLLPVVLGSFYFRSLNHDIRFLVVLFFLFFIRDISSNFLAYFQINNLFIYNLFSILELVFLSLIFCYDDTIKVENYRRVIRWLGIACILASVFLYTRSDFSTGDFVIVRLYGIFLTIFFFERALSDVAVKNIVKYPMFWVASGFLLYFCGTFFIFLLSSEVLSSHAEKDTFTLYWDTNLIFYIIFCLLSSVGIYVNRYANNIS